MIVAKAGPRSTTTQRSSEARVNRPSTRERTADPGIRSAPLRAPAIDSCIAFLNQRMV